MIADEHDTQKLKELGLIANKIRRALIVDVQPGENGLRLNARAKRMMEKAEVNPAPPTVGFPAEICVSINDCAAHGIPNDQPFQEGDLVNIDVSLEKDGYWIDTGESTLAGNGNFAAANALNAVNITLGAMTHAAKPGTNITELAEICERTAKRYNMTPLIGLGGHGTGDKLHGDPHISNAILQSANYTLQAGEVIAIEPLLTYETGLITKHGEWELKTKHGLPAVQKEHTIIVQNKPIILT